MPRSLRFSIFGSILLVLVAASALGQGTTATVTGTAMHAGSPLPGVVVTATSPSLQGARTAVTGEAGGYNMPGLPPGRYTISFELEGMQRVTKTTVLSLAQTSRVDADLLVSAVAEAITVTATAPAVLETNEVSRNFTSEIVDKLPVARTIRDTVLLAPGVSSSGVNNQITISGAPSYDNLFLVNGVVVNENLRGQPHNLFIEDAIQETTVLTGAVSAEYGRFTGGVVSTLTKSGGNEFSGSVRDTMTNSAWRAKTPWATEADHVDKIDQTYEATLGGYLLRDRLWFFGAGRMLETSDQRFTRETNLPYVFGSDEQRMELKLTGQVTPRHNAVFSYLAVDRTETNNAFQNVLDLNTVDDERMLPNTLMALQYNGVWTNNLLFEAQYSEKRFTFESSGGNDTSRVGGSWLYDLGRLAFANAPVFCGVCDNDEKRDNDSFVAKATYFLNTTRLGTHNLSAGIEDYAETRVSNNFQSASQYEIFIGGGHIVGGEYFPRFDTGTTIRYRPIFELSPGTDFATQSAFVNDRWELNQNFSFNIGFRYDANDGRDASGNLVSDDKAISPRLGMMYDLFGNGRHRFNLYYGSYVTKIADGNVGGSGQAAGNPSLFSWTYRGPAINPTGTPNDQLMPTREALAQVFAWFDSIGGNTNRVAGDGYLGSSIAGFVTEFPDSIASPAVDEISLGYGVQVGRAGVVRVDAIQREWKNFYAAHLDMTTGTKVDPEGFVGDLAYTINEDSESERSYKGIQIYSTFRPGRWNLGGGYTWSELKGNDLGEGAGTATIRNLPLSTYYPEYLNYAARRPVGFLAQDQTHRARVWAGYTLPLFMGSTIDISVLQRYDSGFAYSALGTIDASARTTPFDNAPANPGYRLNQLGTTHDYFFSERGEFRTDDELNTDVSLYFTIPVMRVSLFANAVVNNAFDNDAVTVPNQTIVTRRTGGASSGLVAFNPFTETPVEGVHWRKGANFGKPVGVASYQIPREYRLSLGVRF